MITDHSAPGLVSPFAFLLPLSSLSFLIIDSVVSDLTRKSSLCTLSWKPLYKTWFILYCNELSLLIPNAILHLFLFFVLSSFWHISVKYSVHPLFFFFLFFYFRHNFLIKYQFKRAAQQVLIFFIHLICFLLLCTSQYASLLFSPN